MNESNSIVDIKRRLACWASVVAADIGTGGVYAFGSLVYRDGAQFGPGSDVDLVVLFPNQPGNPLTRREWLEKLLAHKQRLEIGSAKCCALPIAPSHCAALLWPRQARLPPISIRTVLAASSPRTFS
jgi:hypothetical protein